MLQRPRTWGLVVALAVGLPTAAHGEPAPAAAAAAIEKDELLALLRAVPGVSAKYREEQHIALLAAPLVSEGMMYFAPSAASRATRGRLAKHQQTPAPARMLVDGDRLQFADAFGRDELDLAKNPVVALFVDSVLRVLAGDVDALERAWIVGFAPAADVDPRGWILVLRPRADSAARIVESLAIRGRDAVVQRIEIVERGGDRTVTTFSQVDTARTWETAELAEVFSVTAR